MSVISAGTTTTTAFKVTGDTTGTLQLQTGAVPTTAINISASQVVTFPATTTLDFTGTLRLSGGTANGVLYLNGSKDVTGGSTLTFDGTTFTSGAHTLSTGVLTVPAGTVSAPAITTSGDTNTGIFFPAADTIAFTEGGVESMRIDASGNMGLGTTSPDAKLKITSTNISAPLLSLRDDGTPAANLFLVSANSFGTAAVINSSGNFGIGGSPSAWQTGRRALQIIPASTQGHLAFNGVISNISTNAFVDSTPAWKYIANGIPTLYQQDEGRHFWYTAPTGTAGNTISWTQAMTLDASGNLLVGTTSTSANIQGVTPRIIIQPGSSTGSGLNFYSTQNNAGQYVAIGTQFSAGNTNNCAQIQLGIDTGGDTRTYIGFATANGAGSGNFAERARITSGGALLVGTTAFTQSGNRAFGAHWSYTGSGGEGGCEFRNTSTSSASDPNPCLILQKGSTTTSSDQRFIQFYANTTSQPMGGIVGNGATNVQFVSLSDARQKTNIQSISGSLEKILALNPVSFDWIKSGEHVKAGFVAQNVEQVFPEFVVENFDTENGEPRKGLTGGMTGGIIAHLVKAIQELSAKVAALESK